MLKVYQLKLADICSIFVKRIVQNHHSLEQRKKSPSANRKSLTLNGICGWCGDWSRTIAIGTSGMLPAVKRRFRNASGLGENKNS